MAFRDETPNLELIQLLIDRGADVNDGYGEREEKPLSWAARYGLKEVVELLLNSGAEADAEAVDSALSYNQLEIVTALLDAGANPNIALAWKQPILYQAVAKGQKDVVELLLRYPITDVNIKVKSGETSLIGNTPLHVAVENGELEIAALLLAHGADATIANEAGKTPLDVAQANQHRSDAFRNILSMLRGPAA